MVKSLPANVGDVGSVPLSGKIPWRRKGQPTPVFLPGELHGQRSLAGCSPWGCAESDTTERPHFLFSLFSSVESRGQQARPPGQCVLHRPHLGGPGRA